MNNYLEVVYDEKLRPVTSYPEKLAKFRWSRELMLVGSGRKPHGS